MVLIFIFALISVTFFSVITVGTRHILISKNRLGAIALANEKMEIVRNLKFEDVGTVSGVVSGNIPQEEDVETNGKKYTVETLVRYEDDPFDGTLGGSPNDAAYKDYKTVKIIVSWNNGGQDQGSVDVVSRFVPPGLEVASSGEGILSISVFSDQAEGAGVAQSSVHITNPDTGVDETIQTNDAGNATLVGAGESINNYRITVSKSGYEAVSTFAPYPETVYDPVDVHASVVEGTLNMVGIIQNKLAAIKLQTKDYLGNDKSDISFKLTGGRKLGTNVLSPFDNVYNLDVSDQTNGDGEKVYDSVSPGDYNLELTSDDYEIIGTNPALPFFLSSEMSQEVEIKVAEKNKTSILFLVQRNSDNTPIEGASVQLKNESLSYDQTITTKSDGMAFFPIEETPPFQAGIYNLIVKADGYEDINAEEIVANSILTKSEILMLPN